MRSRAASAAPPRRYTPAWRRLAAASAALVIACVSLVGCGGGGEGEREQPSPPSAGEYAEVLDAELAAFNSEFATLGEEAAAAGSAEEYLEAVRDMHGRIQATLDELEAMRPPAEAEDVHARLVEAFAGLARAYEAMANAVEGGEEGEIRAAGTALERASRRFTRQAREIDRAASRAGLELEQLRGAGSGGAS
jgi:hypothetical protein